MGDFVCASRAKSSWGGTSLLIVSCVVALCKLKKSHRSFSMRQLQKYGLYETTQKIRPETDPGDLWNIYLMIKELKPRRVLEYGSGASTYIILRALEEKDQGSLLSYERDEEYGLKGKEVTLQDNS